jgi:beta-lactamase regulating signal transducer with metallopeptidase domain
MMTPLAAVLAWTLVHFIWQGAAIGLAAFVLLRFLRFGASTRYAIGLAALIIMATAPVVTFTLMSHAGPRDAWAVAAVEAPASLEPLSDAVSAPSGEPRTTNGEPRTTNGEPRTANGAARARERRLTGLILAAWLTGVFVLSLRLFGGYVVARRYARRAIRPVSSDIEQLAARLIERLAPGRVVRIFESSRIAVPVMLGWLRPVVLMPAAALAGLSTTQVEALIAHELAHIRRHDYLVNLFQSVIETLLFYHPAVWWVSRQVREDREHCCDEVALGVCDRLVYATALAELASIKGSPRLALAATDGPLLDRVRRILGAPNPSRPTTGWWPVFLIVLIIVAAIPTAFMASGGRLTAAQVVVPPSAVAGAPRSEMTTRTGTGSMSFRDNNERVQIQWTGAFRLTPDERDVEWIEPGARVKVSNGARWLATGVEVIGGVDGTLDRHHFVRGFEKAFEPQGRAYLALSLQRLIGHTSLNAAVRVDRLLTQGGPEAVLAEIGRLESDSTRGLYYRLLVEQANLAGEPLVGIVTRAVGSVSDSALAGMIDTASTRVDNEAQRVALAGAAKRIASGSYRLRALRAIMPDRMSSALAAAVLDAAGGLSDSTRASLLMELVEHGGLTPATRDLYFASVDGISSATYRGRVLRSVSASPDVPDVIVHSVLDSARAVSTDVERARIVQAAIAGSGVTAATAPKILGVASAVQSSTQRTAMLIDFIEKGGLTDQTAAGFFPLVSSLSSSSSQRKVLDAVLAQPRVSPAILGGVLGAAADMTSDTERTRLLLAVLEKHQLAGANRELYFAATDRISSETHQARALAALARAERSRR